MYRERHTEIDRERERKPRREMKQSFKRREDQRCAMSRMELGFAV